MSPPAVLVAAIVTIACALALVLALSSSSGGSRQAAVQPARSAPIAADHPSAPRKSYGAVP